MRAARPHLLQASTHVPSQPANNPPPPHRMTCSLCIYTKSCLSTYLPLPLPLADAILIINFKMPRP